MFLPVLLPDSAGFSINPSLTPLYAAVLLLLCMFAADAWDDGHGLWHGEAA